MADVHNKEIRSKNMKAIRSKDTKPERIVRQFLYSKGIHYRKHLEILPGKPDLALSKYNTVIFVHGCFFHGHSGCKDFKLPESNTNFWKKKIEGNCQRDEVVTEKLKKSGWQVVIIWECELKTKVREITLNGLLEKLNFKSLSK